MDGINKNGMSEGDLRKIILRHIEKTHGNIKLRDSDDPDGIRLIPFKGTSMLPGLKEGDILAVLPPKETAPKVGEIILTEKDEKAFIAHRVIGFDRSGTFARTRGDSRLFRDRLWHPRCAYGLVIAVLRDNSLMSVPPPPGVIRRYLIIGKFIFSAIARRLTGRRPLVARH
ncbi:MAG: S26 family signal peptidase [Desulfobacterales bacterium]|nr:S26 family signal peptidase [Desulfobacterales bacterium]